MRPRLLEIEGLQSFRDLQRIDFETLGETGLFGIFGPTGSGKSTVLDAITFALYGRVKRAERGTQGIINTNMNTARVAFTFELLKEGGRKTYRVERAYQRKKGSDNSCEPRVARLIEVTGAGEIPICDRASEVGGSVEQLLGLNHDDFTRAVVLPQNSFQEFLLLDNSKKREMLERIFYLEEYGKRLQERVNGKITGLRSRMDMLSGELKGYADATDEVLAAAGKDMESAAAEKDRAEKELKLLGTRYDEAKEVWQHVRDLSAVAEREERHAASREAIDGKRAALDRAVKAGGLAEMIRKSRELGTKLSETEKKLKEAADSLAGAAEELKRTQQRYEAVKNEAASEQPGLLALKTRLTDALSVKAEIEAAGRELDGIRAQAGRLGNEISAKSEEAGRDRAGLEALEKDLGRLQAEVKALTADPEYRHQIQEGVRLESEAQTLEKSAKEHRDREAALNGAAAILEKKLGRVREGISHLQAAVEAIELERQKHEALLPGDRRTALEYKEQVHALQAVYDILKIRKTELDGIGLKKTRQESALEELEIKARALEEAREKSSRVCEQCRLELENAVRLMEGNTAYMLSKKLKEGESCPVCGSQHHPAPAARPEESGLTAPEQRAEQAGERLAGAERAFREAERNAIAAGEQIKAFTLQSLQTVQEMESKAAEYDAVKLGLPVELQSMGPEQIYEQLGKMNAAGAERLAAAEAREKKLEEYRTQLRKLNEGLTGEKLAENGILTELKVAREGLEQSEKALEALNAELGGKRREYADFLRRHGIGGAADELKRLTENDRRAGLLQKRAEQARELAEKKRALLERRREELVALNGESIRLQAEIGSLGARRAEKELRLKELAGASDIEAEIQRIDGRLGEYARLETLYRERLKAAEKLHGELLAGRASLENQRGIYSEELQREKSLLEASLSERGFTGVDEVEKSLIPGEGQKALRGEIDEFDRAGMNILAQKEMLLKKLGSRFITEEEWSRTDSAYKELAAYKEECAARSEVARSNYGILKRKHDRWAELNRAYTALAGKYGLLDQIQKLLRAERGKDNSFIDYIAEERLRYVAARASETLGVMTKYKYALELDTDAGFVIRDNANGGVHRMVASLSGGETFLTSLALALALSEQIQLKGQSPLEFFFLDEGFGTLDNDLLDTVVDALERLSRRDRVIGLISHVPELRNRLPRRLVIEPPAQGGGSRARIEKA